MRLDSVKGSKRDDHSALGLLLVNLGTPDAPNAVSVRRYLRQFLMDERVLDLPFWRRFLLVHLLILPTRPKRSAASYRKIWTDRGSPLLFHGLDLRDRLQQRLGEQAVVELAMRYGRPAIEPTLEGLIERGVDRLVVLPLYAQASEASTGSTLAELERVIDRRFRGLRIEVVPPFFEHASFLEAKARMIRPVIESQRPDLVLFSYHGLPVRQLKQTAPAFDCMQERGCCDREGARLACYRAQCFANARALAARLGLEDVEVGPRYRVSFQSRLGRTPWIPPFTDQVLREEASGGCRRIVVVTGFVADCLETLEEIALGGRELFREHGGEELELVPAPNAEDAWVEAILDLFEDARARLAG